MFFSRQLRNAVAKLARMSQWNSFFWATAKAYSKPASQATDLTNPEALKSFDGFGTQQPVSIRNDANDVGLVHALGSPTLMFSPMKTEPPVQPPIAPNP